MSEKHKKRWNKMTDSKSKQPGMRRRFKGKTVLPGGSPRASTHGGHSVADAGYTTYDCPAGKGNPPGRFRVSAPTKRWQRRGIVRNGLGEQQA